MSLRSFPALPGLRVPGILLLLFMVLLLLFMVLLSVPGQSRADVILLQDNFNDNSLDGSKWSVVTAGIPVIDSSPSVTETNQRIEIANRGHLVTAQEYDPLITGPLVLTGTWTFASNDDFMQVLTRSDGVPGGAFGETTNGVEFFAERISGMVEIRGRGAASVATVSAFTTIDQNDVFAFTIIDDGLNLTFTMSEIGGEGAFVSISTTSASDLTNDFIVFHNREQRIAGQDEVAFLDDVTLTAVPEPATVFLLTSGLVALAAIRRRRQR